MKDKIVRVMATPSILNKTNPEIFTTKPRPGGLIVSLDNDGGDHPLFDEFDVAVDLYKTTSREYRLTAALEESNWSMEDSEGQEESVAAPDPLSDCLDMLAVTISTIMFLAADASSELTKEQLNWTIQYLKCIQDEFGNVPPNVRGILNHLKHLYNNDLDQFADKPVCVDEFGRVIDDAELDLNKTERTTTKVTHKSEEEEGAPPAEEQ
ncbi:uncharacterized protein LOC123313375 [Coccinella septempunctata]|uniref:uncharacterized protein LOC123313375 n=1 Tax=Coccinella septempunctata TaxID=41139 RepID=UPI001D08DC72|nr:uncharacterized protein LOC123313375 [Coccinella septempunctata]